MKRFSALLAVFLLFAAMALASPAPAANFSPSMFADRDSGSCAVANCSLREAIKYQPAGTTILLDDGDYSVTLGEIPVTKNMTVTGNGYWRTGIIGNDTSRILNVSAGTFRLSDLLIMGGTYSNPSGGGPGGGAILNASTAVLSGVYITGCVSQWASGGGIYNSGALTLLGCQIMSCNLNVTSYNGGGIASYGGTVRMEDSSILYNRGGSGAGVYAAGGGINRLTVIRSIIKGNTCENSNNCSGGLRVSSGILDVVDSEISGNSGSRGGGLFTEFCDASIENSAVTGNHASENSIYARNGGGLYHRSGILHVTNSTFSGNTALDSGGGIYLESDSSPIRFSFVTITANQADSDADGSGNAGGIYLESGSPEIKATIIAGNVDSSPPGFANYPDASHDSGQEFVNLHYNVIGDRTSSGFIPLGTPTANNDWIGDAASPVNPRLAPLADNGGPTKTHALLAGSPAMNNGPNPPLAANGSTLVSTDQRGLPRPIGPSSDIGAYEGQAAGAAVFALLLDE